MLSVHLLRLRTGFWPAAPDEPESLRRTARFLRTRRSTASRSCARTSADRPASSWRPNGASRLRRTARPHDVWVSSVDVVSRRGCPPPLAWRRQPSTRPRRRRGSPSEGTARECVGLVDPPRRMLPLGLAQSFSPPENPVSARSPTLVSRQLVREAAVRIRFRLGRVGGLVRSAGAPRTRNASVDRCPASHWPAANDLPPLQRITAGQGHDHRSW